MKLSLRTNASVLVLSLAVAGCVAPGSTTVQQTTKVNYYPQCYQPVAQLRQQDEQFQQVMAANTVMGAVTGAALGGIIGGNWRSALFGAVAGATTAAANTYAQARLQQEANDESRRGLIAGDMARDSGELQRAVIAARQADDCYGHVYTRLAADVRRGAISKEEARPRFVEIDQGERETSLILAEYGKKARGIQEQYQVAFDQEAQRLNTTPDTLVAEARAPSPSATPSTSAKRSSNTKQMASNYTKVNQQVSEINQEQSTIERTASDQRNDLKGLGIDVTT